MRIAVSGINANDNPGPGVGVARSLKQAFSKAEIVGLSYDGHDSGHYLHQYFHRTHMMPLPGRGWAELLKRLTAIHEETPLDLIVPCLDAELPLYIQNQAHIQKELGIKLFLPSVSQFEARGKNHLMALSKKIGVKHPKTLEVNSVEAMRKAIDSSFPFPFFLKGKYYKAYRVSSYYEALLHFDEIAAEWGYPLLMQQIVAGMEINLIGLADGKGSLLGSVAVKKLTTTHLGKIWTAVSIRNAALTKLAEIFAERTKWKGPFELECIATPKETYVIEINPRFPAWAYFATACGVNLPELLVRSAKGESVKPAPPGAVGKLLVRYCEEIIADWAGLIQATGNEEKSDEAKDDIPYRKTG